MHFCSERFFSLPPRGRWHFRKEMTEGECVQKQIRCLFGWCNTIVAQAPSTTAWSPFLSEEGMRDLAFSCTFAVCAAVCVCLRTTDGRPYGKHGAPIGGKSNIGENSGLVVPEFYREPSPSAYKTRSVLPPNKGKRHKCSCLRLSYSFFVKVFGGVGAFFQKSPHVKTASPRVPKKEYYFSLTNSSILFLFLVRRTSSGAA